MGWGDMECDGANGRCLGERGMGVWNGIYMDMGYGVGAVWWGLWAMGWRIFLWAVGWGGSLWGGLLGGGGLWGVGWEGVRGVGVGVGG